MIVSKNIEIRGLGERWKERLEGDHLRMELEVRRGIIVL